MNANVLIVTYLILTFGELLLSPMGISFVSKVGSAAVQGYDDGSMVRSDRPG